MLGKGIYWAQILYVANDIFKNIGLQHLWADILPVNSFGKFLAGNIDSWDGTIDGIIASTEAGSAWILLQAGRQV